jgi:hypothetical protein
MDRFDFHLPEGAPADMVAAAQIGAAVSELTTALDSLHRQHQQLRERVDALPTRPAPAAGRPGPAEVPSPLRWVDLDREQAAQLWAWLISWVDWLVDRYQLSEEIPFCWYRHPPLVEELTALAAAWHAAYDDNAHPDSPLAWHERFGRARDRLRGWDDATRCRNGSHTDRRIELAWPELWQQDALERANADLTGRPEPARPAGETS